MKRHIFGGICQVLFRKKWGDFNYEQRKSLEKSRLRIPRRYKSWGGEYIIPTLGVWNEFDDIDFSTLPDCFVLKCTHDSGGIAICKDKEQFDYSDARNRIIRSLKCNYYSHGREWPYKDVPPK